MWGAVSKRLFEGPSSSGSLSNSAGWGDAERESQSYEDSVISWWIQLGEVVGEVEVSRAVHRSNGSGLACASDPELAHWDVPRELSSLGVVGQLDGRHVVHQDGHCHDS